MKNILTSKTFWITTVIVTIIFFFAGISVSKTYKGEMELLLLPKNDITARNINQVMQNAQEIPMSLSFYNKLIEFNPDIEDTFKNLSDSKRKENWNAKIEIEKIKESGIIKISVYDDAQLQTELISKQTALDTAKVLGKYYNILTELDVKIIDGPIVSSVSKTSSIGLFIFSLIAGLIAGIAGYFLVKFLPEDEIKSGLSSLENYFKTPTKEEADENEKVNAELSGYFSSDKKEAEDSSEVYHIEKRASAPENLPIIDESVFALPEEKPLSQTSNENIPQNGAREATQEEIKARLNKLLNS